MRLTFLGGADEIGASSILVETSGCRVLVDCGLRMGGAARDPLPDLRSIQEHGGLDAVVLTHAHLDHTGALPLLHSSLPNVPVFATAPTLTLLKVLLFDAVKIMGGKLDHEGELPLYSQEAVEGLLARAKPTRFLEPYELTGGAVTLTHFPAGHILGASLVAIESAEGRVLVSGDFSVSDQITVPGTLPPKLRADLVLVESTYGDRLHANRLLEERRLVETVRDVVAAGGKVLIPAFALGRAQEVILILKRAFAKKQLPEIPVWVDGMVRSVCEAYSMYPEWVSPYLRRRIEKQGNPFFDREGPVRAVEKPAQRAEIAQGPPCCIVASSGMLSGGPSQQFAAMLAPDPKNLIAITGYQDEEAPGRVLLDLAEGRSRDLRIGGQVVPVACRVGRYSLSAHADGAEVAGLLGHLRPLDVVLVHGEGNARPGLARAAAPQVRDGVYLPSLGDTLEFAYRRPRERVVLQALPGFGKERLPDGPGLAALAGALRTRGPEGRLFDVRELAQYWAGPSGGGDSELRDRLRGWLDAAGSPFEADARRPFLYRLRKEPAVPVEAAMAPGAAPAGAESGPLEQTAATAKIDALLPSATGLYRKSFRVEERRVELCFEFPAVAARLYAETIGRLCEETGWTVSVYPEVRLSSLFEAVSRTVPSDWQVARQPAYHREKGLVVLHIASVPPDWQEQTTPLSRRFEEETGLRLVFERGGPEDAPVREQRDAEGRIEINQAMAALDRAFRDCPHRPGKKSRKTDAQGPYLELGFISPAVAVRYTAAIEAVAREIGWRVVVGDRTDQIAILSVFRELWPSEWPIRKGPSLHVAQGRLAVVSGWQPPAAELAPIAAALKERTGFELVVG